MANAKGDPKEEEDDDDDVEDLVSAINYNTITSMLALKEMLGNDSRTSSEDVSWFQHYFLRHVNRLPSRSQYAGRRLSECKEEDEGLDNDVKTESPPKQAKLADETAAYSNKQYSNTLSSSSSTPTSPSSSMPSSPRKVHSYETPPTSPRCSRGASPHFDKRFFEAGLIEMKSQASSSSTLDDSSNDDVWVKRIDARRKKDVPVLASKPHGLLAKKNRKLHNGIFSELQELQGSQVGKMRNVLIEL